MEAVGKRYGSREQFMKIMSPTLHARVIREPERCFFGDAPTLAVLNATYGENTAVAWLMVQLNSVSRFCGCREKLTDEVTEELATGIASEWYYIKTSEFLLFFGWLKMGRYGTFYGNVDPIVICSAFRQFLEERNSAYSKHEQYIERQRRKNESENAITYEEWQKRKERQKENT